MIGIAFEANPIFLVAEVLILTPHTETADTSNRRLLIAAAVTGLIATGLTFVFLANHSPEGEEGPANTVLILAAARDLSPDSTLDPDADLEELKVPATMGDFIRRCLRPQERSLIKGRRVVRPVPAGTPLTFADLMAAEIELKGDRRALSLAVNGANGLPGLLAPGQWVKIVATRAVKAAAPAAPIDPKDPAALLHALSAGAVESPQEWVAEFVPSADDMFRVIAVGGRLVAMPDLVMRDGDSEDRGANVVTIEVTEDQARAILARSGGGRAALTLILCPRAERATP